MPEIINAQGQLLQTPSTEMGLRQRLIETANGTFSKADYPWLARIRVIVIGGGGSSGGCAATGASTRACSGGGGGGGYAEKIIDVANLNADENYAIGSGAAAPAAGNNNGSTGGTTTFGTTPILTATGGGGGNGSSASSGDLSNSSGVAGTGSGGDINITATRGGPGILNGGTIIPTHRGGASLLSGQVNGGYNVVGETGLSYGGGGGGSSSGVSLAAKTGAAGADGVVIIELYG